MTAVVIYESMFGATRQVAEAIGRGIEQQLGVLVIPVQEVTGPLVENADLLVAGGPTHMHSLSRPFSRKAAAKAAAEPDSGITLETGADGPGLREWLDTVTCTDTPVAAFDTRIRGPRLLTGQASRRISRLLRRHGGRQVAAPRSFLVSKTNALLPGELERAQDWGTQLAQAARKQRDRV